MRTLAIRSDSKPAFFGSAHAAAFQDPDVAASYHARPPYLEVVFELLSDLLGSGPRVVLDLGCGTGAIARRMAPDVERVDALDVSSAMVEAGRRSPGGDHPAIRWIVGRAEDGPLHPPYGLVAAAASLH